MGDERAVWQETEAALHLSDSAAAAALGDEPIETPAPEKRPAATVRACELTEVLRIRWDTPRGRKVRAAVIRDLRFEASAHLAEILSDLRAASDVPGFHDLRFVRLDGENLSHTRLGRADLTGASLAKTALVSADLSEARLTKARLVGAALREADLSRADFSDANLTEATLEGATAVSASFVRARCIGAVFRGTSLVGADLRGAMLVRAVFESADLGGASVEGAHALAGAFARATQQPGGLAQVNELILGEPSSARPAAARVERTRTGSFTVEPAHERRPTSRPALETPPPASAATRSWDTALASLLLQRGRVSRISIVVDGVERVAFER